MLLHEVTDGGKSSGSLLNAPVGVVEFLSTGRSVGGWCLYLGLAEPCKYQVVGYTGGRGWRNAHMVLRSSAKPCGANVTTGG